MRFYPDKIRIELALKFGLSEKYTKFEKNLPYKFYATE